MLKIRRYLVPILLLVYDAIVALTSPFLALFLRFEGEVPLQYIKLLYPYLPLILLTRLFFFFVFRLYHRVWRHAGLNEMLAVLGATTASTIIITAVMLKMNSGLPRSIFVLSWGIVVALVGLSRLILRIYYYFRIRALKPQHRVLIIGAGDAGAMLAKEVSNHCSAERKVIGFIDDDKQKHGQRLMGIPILGGREHLVSFVREYGVEEIYIAMPSVPGSVIRHIVSECQVTQCTVRILPALYDLIEGKAQLENLRRVDLEDLLRRDPVTIDLLAITGYLTNRVVLVTGAGGSIGSELCRQIARMQPKVLLLLGKGENSIYDIQQELAANYNQINTIPLIADIRDEVRIYDIFQRYQPQVVFHAAAHKHVPLMEMQPVEAVRNNVLGTLIMAKTASTFNIETFVMISTDKAVNPTSVMGATKRIAERIIQRYSQYGHTRFTAVRFGNVLGSRGSVVPLFKKQIAAGGPVTVTDPDMKRYFMTIPEATQLVLQAGSMAENGEVFVLDMGEPVRIVDMAEDLIRLSGLQPYEDIEIVFTKTRPGEKMFEELLTAEEGTSATCHEKIFRANLRLVDSLAFEVQLKHLLDQMDSCDVRKAIRQMVPTYQSDESFGLSSESNSNYHQWENKISSNSEQAGFLVKCREE